MFNTININDKDIMETVELAYITYDGFDSFDVFDDCEVPTDNDNYIYVVICDSESGNLDAVYFQLFTTIEMKDYKYLHYRTFESQNCLELLRFGKTQSFEAMILKTMDYIKFSIKSRCIKSLKREEKLKYFWNSEYADSVDSEEQTKELNTNIDASIAILKDQILDCEKKTVIDETNLVLNFEVIKVYSSNSSDVLCIRNVDLEKIERTHIIAYIKEYLDDFYIPDIEEDKTYASIYDTFEGLIGECDENIELVTRYSAIRKNTMDGKADESADCDDAVYRELLVLLESKKILIKEKMLELESISSILIEKEKLLLEKKKYNAVVVSLTRKITELLEQEHTPSEYKEYNYQFISNYYLGYKNMCKILREVKISELLDKIPLLEAKQRKEEEKENFFRDNLQTNKI
jgi:hypothetical protein